MVVVKTKIDFGRSSGELSPRLSFLFNYITDEKAFRLMLKTIINHGEANSKA